MRQTWLTAICFVVCTETQLRVILNQQLPNDNDRLTPTQRLPQDVTFVRIQKGCIFLILDGESYFNRSIQDAEMHLYKLQTFDCRTLVFRI